MATNLTEITALIAADVIPCPDPIVSREIIGSVQDFCTKTLILTKEFSVTLDPEEIDPDVQDSIDIDLSSLLTNLAPVTVVRFNLDGIEYYPVKKEILNTTENWASIKPADDELYFFFVSPTTLRIYDLSSTCSSLFIALAVKPISTVTSIDDFLFDDWSEILAAGARYRILQMPNKPWTDTQGAIENYAVWRRGISRAKLKQLKAYARRPVEVHPKSFGDID